MKNIIKNLLISLLIIIIFIKRPIIINSILNGIDLWKKIVFPSLFPIMIISDLILSTNIINIVSNTIGIIFAKVFKVSKYASYVFFMSLFSGCPTNAKYIKDLLNNNLITLNEASKILSMSLLYNPILIITVTSFLNYQDSILLIIFNVISNIIIGLINRNIKCDIKNQNMVIKKFNLVDSISNSINVLLLILGSIITFITLSALIPIKHPIINGILEITSGLNQLNNFDIIYKYKFIFSAFLMSFGGFSILIQIKSIFKDTNINYTLYYKSRIIHLILMLLLSYLRFIVI